MIKFKQLGVALTACAALTYVVVAAAFPGCPTGQSGGAHKIQGALAGMPADCLTMMCHPVGQRYRQTHVGQCMRMGLPPVIESCTIVDFEYQIIAQDVPGKDYCPSILYTTNDWH